MVESQIENPSAVRFTLGAKSQTAKMRWWMWGGLATGIGISLLTSGFKAPVLAFFAVSLLIVGLFDWFVVRRRTRVGQLVVTVDADGIESPHFTTQDKRYPWAVITGVSVEATQAGRMLQLQLRASPARADKRGFFNGIDPSRPQLGLAALDDADQERLYDLVARRVRDGDGTFSAEPGPAPDNVLVQERLFAAQLKALAPQTWVTWGLVALNVAVWLGVMAAGAGPMRADAALLFRLGGNSAWAVQHGEIWRLLTATFLHSGAMHLLMNMVGLFATGAMVERIYGHRLFVLIYLGAALAGSATSLHFSAQKVVSVGASGAVFGVAGALLVAVFHHSNSLPRLFRKQTLTGMGCFVAYSLFQGMVTPGIDNAAHVGGLLAGALLASILPEKFDMDHFRRTARVRSLVALFVVAVGTGAVAITARPASFDLREQYAAGEALQRGVVKFAAALKELEHEAAAFKSGKLSELEADERSRTLHAPRFREVLQELNRARFPPGDVRAALADDYRQFTALMVETLAMESKVVDGKPVPVNPGRSEEINAQVKLIGARITKAVEALKSQKR